MDLWTMDYGELKGLFYESFGDKIPQDIVSALYW